MIEIINNLFVGNDYDCSIVASDFAIIHACKTCHQKGIGYRGSLPSSHPNYLIFEQKNHLYLNMVDMEQELLPRLTHPIMNRAILFIEKNITKRPVLIHCNQGYSRSPSIGLVYLARENKINSNSYPNARNDFISIYPDYLPGQGIELYLMNNWEHLMSGELRVEI